MTSGNPTLDKNLECIKLYNPKLAEDLLNLPFLDNDIQLVETDLKEPNLTYNGLELHSKNGAESEAKAIFKTAKNTSLDVNIVFGIGLGYLFKEFCTGAIGSVILFEPNLEILRVTFELVDFSKELSQKNVKVVSDFQQLRPLFYSACKYKSEVFTFCLNSYNSLYGEEIQTTIEQAELLRSSAEEDFKILKYKGLSFVTSTISNMCYSIEAMPLLELKDAYKGKTALVVSAGPTLDLNIETIKKYKDKVVIFCVGTAFKSLASNGIVPDFVVQIEQFDCSGQLSGYDLSKTNLIIAPETSEAVQKLDVKQKFLFPASTTQAGRYWSELTGIDVSEYILGGTVSYCAIASAKMLGCNKIVLVGQDLAFINNSCYSKDSAYADLVFEINPETGKAEYKAKDHESYLKHLAPIGEEVTDYVREVAEDKLRQMNKASHFIKGISGEMLPTDLAYKLFVDLFSRFANDNKNLELINTSMLGAQIDGFENLPLEKAIENGAIFDKIEFSKGFKYDKGLIIANLNKEKILLENVLAEFEKGKEYLRKIDRELQSRRIMTDNAQKYYVALTQVYNEITDKYFDKNQLYKIISAGENMEIQHYIETTQKSGGVELNRLYGLLKDYFVQVEPRVLDVLNKVENQIEKLHTGLN